MKSWARSTSFLIALLALGALTLWLGPRPVHEPWAAELLDSARAQSLGANRILANVPAGTISIDLDADGDGDLERFEIDGTALRLYWNDGAGPTREVSKLLGPAFTSARRAKKCACADFDRDGRMDLAVQLEDDSVLILWNKLDQRSRKEPP